MNTSTPRKALLTACSLLITCFLITTDAKASKTPPSNPKHLKPYTSQEIQQLLNWIPNPQKPDLCHGHYKIPKIVLQTPQPKPFKEQTTHIRSLGPTTLKKNGVSILNQNIVITQPGRIVKADRATIYRNEKTGKIRYIHLDGHVRLEEPNTRVVATSGTINYEKNTASFLYALYRIYHQSNTPAAQQFDTPQNTSQQNNAQQDTSQLNSTAQDSSQQGAFTYSWGKAQHFFRDQDANLTLTHATYSSCSPANPVWYLKASTININHQEQEGTVYNALLLLHHVPVFYTPFFKFPAGPKRKSGFLNPRYGNSDLYGFKLATPYYLNLAPSYDDTITPIIYTKAGIQLHNLFRLITHRSSITLFTSYMPRDKVFNRYKQQHSQATSDPATKILQNSKTHRGFFSFNDRITLYPDPTTIHTPESQSKSTTRTTLNSPIKPVAATPTLNANIALQYVTDPYYLNQYGSRGSTLQSQQLLNTANINYAGKHWQSSASLSGYQTLHAIGVSATDQYRRLPEIDATGNYSDVLGNNDFNITSQFTHFSFNSSLDSNLNYLHPIGQRLYIQPELSHNFMDAYGYIKPAIVVDILADDAKLSTSTQTRPDFNQTRVTPILSIDTGSSLQRRFDFRKSTLTQTLEPRVMYTFIPYQNQNAFPVFDTTILPFSWNQIFSYNAFTGPDRIQNTSQIGIGLTSRIMNADDNSNIVTASMGMIRYMKPRRVCLSLPCTTDDSKESPLNAQISYVPALNWSTGVSAAWDFQQHDVNNAGVSINYNKDRHRVFNLGYQFVHASPTTPTNANLLSLGLAWPLGHHLSSVNYLYYDVSQQHYKTLFLGLQYNSCCWAIMAAFSKDYAYTQVGPLSGGGGSFSIEFMLKDLGGRGIGSANSIIARGIPGYTNPFASTKAAPI